MRCAAAALLTHERVTRRAAVDCRGANGHAMCPGARTNAAVQPAAGSQIESDKS
jgi:hypothetical protein